MKSLICFITLYCFSLFQLLPICPKYYQCDGGKVEFENKQCVGVEVRQVEGYRLFNINTDQCGINEKCNLNYPEISTCQTIKMLEANEKCFKSEECLSSNCQGNICFSFAKNSKCVGDGDCENGYFCDLDETLVPMDFTCQLQKAELSTCFSEFDCKNNLGCLNSKCTKYFSLPDGSETTDYKFCQSGESQTKNGILICVTTNLLSKDVCIPNQTFCDYKDATSGWMLQKSCACSSSDINRQYCPMGSIDLEWKETIRALVDFYTNEAVKKHTLNRHKYPFRLSKRVHETINYPELDGADSCTVSLFANASFMRLSIISALLLLLF